MKKSCLLLALFALFTVACGDDDAPKAPNLALASLTVSSGTLTPAFDPAVTAYTVSVSNTVEQITVTGIASDANATVVVDPESPSELKSGSNLVMVWVFSADGSAFKVYRVTVTQTSSTNAFLGSLVASAGALTPTFSSNVYTYVLNVAHADAAITFTADAADGTAGVGYTPSSTMALSVGSNYATVMVTAQDGTTTKEYRVVIRRNGATPSDLTSPTVSGITLKGVPAGAFQRDAMVANASYVSAFRISQTEITRAQFNTVMGADPSQTACSSGTSDPVQYVNWYHAIAFCNKLSIRDGLGQVYSVSGVNFSTLTFAGIPTTSNATWNAATASWSASGYRLPTEMEWQWAAMGAEDARGKLFAGGDGSNTIDAYAWYTVNSGGKTHPVGNKLPNELGLSDMSGNISEWCWDWYGNYPAGYQADYRGAAMVDLRVYRGGNWFDNASRCAVAIRPGDSPDLRYNFLGFRVVRP